MTDKNINIEREATDRLRSELSSVLGASMGISTVNPSNTKEELQKLESQIHSALERHNKDTVDAQFDMIPTEETLEQLPVSAALREEKHKEEIALSLQHGMEGR